MAIQSSFILISLVAFLSCLTQGSSKLVVLEEDTSTPHRGLHVIDPPPNVDAGLKVVDIMHFGAKANGKDDDVKAFTQAWEEACHKGGGAAKLLIPEGKYLSSPVDFIGPCLGHITVEVRGTILASDDISTYKGKSWFQFKKIKGLVLTGGGTFDGRGATVWKNDKCNPSSIVIQSVDDAVIHDICSMDSKFFHYHVSDSNNFKAYNLKITAPGDSPNTDGMHISSSNGVEVSNSFIGTGDDCISIGHGVTNANIFGITCGPGHGISIGSLGKRKDETDVTGITVSNCTLTNTTNGARIKTFASDIAIQAKDITFQDIIMNGVQNPIIIDQNYGSKKNNGASKVKVSNVHYKNIRGTTTSNIGIDLDCSSAEPCVGIEFCDVSLDFINTANPDSKKGKAGFTATCLNAKVTYQGVNKIPMCP